tara:strand:+ start:201 stop:545 length:345 start_codon:yes stop_codon:yes gene_type:complete
VGTIREEVSRGIRQASTQGGSREQEGLSEGFPEEVFPKEGFPEAGRPFCQRAQRGPHAPRGGLRGLRGEGGPGPETQDGRGHEARSQAVSHHPREEACYCYEKPRKGYPSSCRH